MDFWNIEIKGEIRCASITPVRMQQLRQRQKEKEG